jgi:cytochrome c
MATRGDAKLGQRFLYGYNCGSCHVIPGIAEATGTVGPPLGGFGSRNYIAGLLVNTPENLVRWITDPEKVEPGSGMPKLGVTEEQAMDISAYLYTLR